MNLLNVGVTSAGGDPAFKMGGMVTSATGSLGARLAALGGRQDRAILGVRPEDVLLRRDAGEGTVPVDVFVVEASSFRLLHSHRFAPDVGTWLNVAPDHLDPTGVGSHASMEDYVAAKARLWAHQAPDQVASISPKICSAPISMRRGVRRVL